MLMAVDAIRVEGRVRKDMGDLAGLAKSIAEIGLIQPVVVRPDGRLVAGCRRLSACRDTLGLAEIEVAIFDPADPKMAERDENEQRKDFTASEKVEMARQVEEELRDRWGGDRMGGASGPTGPLGRTDELSAKAVGLSRGTLRRLKEVVDSGDEELIEAVDKGKIGPTAAVKKLGERRGDQPRPRKVKIDPIGRPDYLNVFYIWLTRGPEVIGPCGDPYRLAELAGKCRVFFDPDKVSTIRDFLASLADALEADQAA